MRFFQTVRQKIERLLQATQALELSNRRKAAYAYTPRSQDQHIAAAEQNARDAVEISQRLERALRPKPKTK